MPELNAAIRNIPLPHRMRSRPVSSKGFPVPWFVAQVNGEWDFRVIGPGKITEALRLKKCWLCGEPTGRHMVFTIGPMCTVNRVSAEPPSHLACAEYAARACPFLNNPRMRRNESDMPEESRELGGVMLKRNPGVTALWVTPSYGLMPQGVGMPPLIQIGEPATVHWYCEGRSATRAEVEAAVASGLPLLHEMADRQGSDAVAALNRAVTRAEAFLPEEVA